MVINIALAFIKASMIFNSSSLEASDVNCFPEKLVKPVTAHNEIILLRKKNYWKLTKISVIHQSRTSAVKTFLHTLLKKTLSSWRSILDTVFVLFPFQWVTRQFIRQCHSDALSLLITTHTTDEWHSTIYQYRSRNRTIIIPNAVSIDSQSACDAVAIGHCIALCQQPWRNLKSAWRHALD